LRLGDKRGAIADFRKALELKPDLRSARENLQQLGVTP
jgi:Flp pilus assembly protein TadD